MYKYFRPEILSKDPVSFIWDTLFNNAVRYTADRISHWATSWLHRTEIYWALSICLSMAGKSSDPPPSYAEAMQVVQLSPRQLTEVVVDQQCNTTTGERPLEQARNEKKISCSTIAFVIFIIKVLIIIWITSK